MNKFIFTLFFAVGLGTAFADAIVRDKSIKEETPKYDMTDIMDFGKKKFYYLELSTGFWGVTIDPKTKRLRTIRGYVLTTVH